MDLSEKDKFVLDRDGENHLNYNPSGISADWQMGCVPTNNNNNNNSISMGVGQAPSCPSVSMVDSFSCSTLWDDHSSNSHNLGISLNTTTTAGNNVPIIKPVPAPSRLDMGGWNPSDHISKDVGVFHQASIGIHPPGGLSSQFPPDSAFIEHAARFSCFGSGTFTSMLSPFDTSNPYFIQSRRNDPNILEGSSNKDHLTGHNRSNGGSPMNSHKDTTNSQGLGEHGDTEFSGGCGGGSGQEETPSEKTTANKRKRNTQEMEVDQTANKEATEMPKENNGVGHKGEPNTSALGVKNNGKQQAKDGGNPPKEDYIHVRARRGQATNSHSLAERVRREKISERMKFLQDLVPGCSKVTGKAVMLDEIINYVQSLQRQVEFLSMKLAAVNPQLDFNLEGFIVSKDIRAGTSSAAIGFSPDLAHQFLNPTSQGGLAQSGVFGIGPPPPDAFRRAINAQLTSLNTFKEAKHQMAISCDDDIQNILSQMGFGNNLPLNIQESNDKTRSSSDGFAM